MTASPLLAENYPNLVMFAQIHQLQELLIIRSCKRIEEMLLKLLTWLGGRFGEAGETGVILKTFLTHQDLAETLNTTRVTMTRSMNQLEHQGTIRHLANRQLFIVRGASPVENRSVCSFDPVSQKLLEHLATSTRHSSIVPIADVALRSSRSLSHRRR